MKLKDKQAKKFLSLFLVFYSLTNGGVNTLFSQENLDSNYFDSRSFRKGRLVNGLTYYLKKVQDSKVLDIRFLVQVGHKAESRNQMDFSHIIEHLAFRESTNFRSGILNSTSFNDAGLTLSNIKAYTGMNSTKYIAKIPVGNSKALTMGLHWFKEIASELTLSKNDVDIERSSIQQEFLSRHGDNPEDYFANKRMINGLFPCYNDKTGFFDHLQTFEITDLRSFYEEWYQPDLMGVSIVGDIEDLDKMEEIIISGFSKLPSSKRTLPFDKCDSLYKNLPNQYVSIARKPENKRELAKNDLQWHLYFRNRESKAEDQLEKWKQRVLSNIAEKVISSRLAAITNDYNIDYAYSVNSDNRSFPENFLELNINCDEDSGRKGIEKSIYILNQLLRKGVLEDEWQDIKNELISNFTSSYFKTSQYWVNDIQNHFLYNDQFNLQYKDELLDWLNKMNLKNLNLLLNKYMISMPNDIGLVAPEGHQILNYSEYDIRYSLEGIINNDTVPKFSYPNKTTALLDRNKLQKLKKSSIISSCIGESGALEIKLENGVKAIFKSYHPTKGLDEKKIVMHAFRRVGASNLPDDYQVSALNSPKIVMHTGLDTINKFDLKYFFRENTNHFLGAFPYITDIESGIEAKSDLNDLETMLQSVYLYFSNVRYDVAAFNDWKRLEEKKYKEPSYPLNFVDFSNKIDEFLDEHRKNLMGTELFESLDETNLENGMQSYRELFGKPEEFTFIFSGEFPLDPVLNLVRKYLGNLPNQTFGDLKASRFNDNKSYPERHYISIPTPKYYKSKNGIYSIRILKDKKRLDWEEWIKLEALAAITKAYFWNLRFKDGIGLYDLTASGGYNFEALRLELAISVFCDFKDLNRVRKESNRILYSIKNGKIPQNVIDAGMKQIKSKYSTQGRGMQQREISQQLYEYYRFDTPWVDPLKKEQFVNSIETEDIITLAKKLINDHNKYEFLLDK